MHAAGCEEAVSAFAFGVVEGGVGGLKQRVGCLAVAGEDGEADARSEAMSATQGLCGEVVANAFCDRCCFGGVRAGEHDRELVATEACCRVGDAFVCASARGEAPSDNMATMPVIAAAEARQTRMSPSPEMPQALPHWR